MAELSEKFLRFVVAVRDVDDRPSPLPIVHLDSAEGEFREVIIGRCPWLADCFLKGFPGVRYCFSVHVLWPAEDCFQGIHRESAWGVALGKIFPDLALVDRDVIFQEFFFCGAVCRYHTATMQWQLNAFRPYLQQIAGEMNPVTSPMFSSVVLQSAPPVVVTIRPSRSSHSSGIRETVMTV